VEAAKISRRKMIMGTVGAFILGGAAGYLAGNMRPVSETQKVSEKSPIKIGFQVHRTGIGADYGYWYERTAKAAVSLINERGGIDGRPVQLIIEDDGNRPAEGWAGRPEARNRAQR
jgi:branched-chain amino acid transport system substrate-binding protein